MVDLPFLHCLIILGLSHSLFRQAKMDWVLRMSICKRWSFHIKVSGAPLEAKPFGKSISNCFGLLGEREMLESLRKVKDTRDIWDLLPFYSSF